MATIERQKLLADKVELDMQEAGLPCLLAGGAPRDWYFGEEANDLDFYLKERDSREVLDKIESLFGVELKELGDEGYPREDQGLSSVYTCEIGGMEVQFMFLNMDPLDYIMDCFDLTVCKIYYKEGEIVTTWEFRAALDKGWVINTQPAFDWQHVDKVMRKPHLKHLELFNGWKFALQSRRIQPIGIAEW